MSVESSMRIAVILSAYDKMSGTINQAVNKAQAKLNGFSKRMNHLADGSYQTGKELVAAGLAVGAPIYKAITAAQDFETRMVDIRKQMNFDTPENVQNMTKQVFQLGRQLPLATSEIQDMIASGLRMGIAEDKIIDYSKSVTKMSVAFDISAGEISDSVGKLSGIYNIPIDNVKDMADAINYLDDNAKSKGRDIIDVMMRTGMASKYMKVNEAAALASTMLSLGESSETSGSGINKLITVLSAAQSMSAKAQKGFAMLGLDARKVQKDFTFDAQNTIIDVFERINKLPQVDQATALNRLFGLEQGPKLTKLVSGIAEYKRELQLTNGAQKGSMDREYAKRIASSAAQWQIFKNKISELSVKIGTTLLPAFNSLIGKAGVLFDKIAGFAERNPGLVKGIMMTAASFSAVALAGGYLSFVIGGVAKFLDIAATGIGFVIRAIGFLAKAFQFLRLVMLANPVIAIIAAIAVAAFLIYKYWDKIKAFFKAVWEGVKKIFSVTWEWIKKMFLNYTPQGLIIKHWAKIATFFSEMWSKVKAIFMAHVNFILGLGTTFYNAGKNIVKSIWEGIKSMAHKPIEAIKNMVGKIRNMLPFSPAKDGPLKDIHKIRLVETIAESIKPASLVNKMNRVAKLTYNAIAKPQGHSVSAIGNTGGGVTMNIHINLSGSATKQDGQIISSEIKKQFSQLMKKYNQQQTRVSF